MKGIGVNKNQSGLPLVLIDMRSHLALEALHAIGRKVNCDCFMNAEIWPKLKYSLPEGLFLDD